ncbi:MAG: M12 family metallo-peptidase [Planctomycetota bacterium]
MLPALTLLLATTASLPPQAPPEPTCPPGAHQRMPFPMQQVIVHPNRLAHCFTPDGADRARIDALRGYRCVRLQSLQLPGDRLVDLELTRIDDVVPDTISLNSSPPHAPTNPRPSPMTSWSGGIAGVPGSQVCITFSAVGVWGFLRTDQKLFQIASFPQGGRWTSFNTLLVDDVDKNRIAGSLCADVIDEPPDLPPNYTACLAGLNPAQWASACPENPIDRLRRCTLAVETDYQFFQRFGDVAAAEVYARFVIGAVAQQLRIDARTVIVLNYLGIHSTVNDPWRKQDIATGQTTAPCCLEVIYEFQHEWGRSDWIAYGARFNLGPGRGNAPVAADIHHLMSGAEMGCAVGVGRIGSGQEAFSLSSGMGALNFDNQNIVQNGVIVWERPLSPYFQIYGAGHEIGHNFGAPHTHALRYLSNGNLVAVDDCAQDPGNGPPDCAPMGFGRGTLMSYCQNCSPGFLRNIRFDYHDQIARCMRGNATNLPVFEDVHFVTDLGFASAPAGRTPPVLTFTGYAPGVDRLQLSSTNNPVHAWRALVISTQGVYAQLPGFTMVPFIEILWSAQAPTTPIDIPLPIGLPPGLVFYFQHFFAAGSDVYGSNALALEIVR